MAEGGLRQRDPNGLGELARCFGAAYCRGLQHHPEQGRDPTDGSAWGKKGMRERGYRRGEGGHRGKERFQIELDEVA